MNISYNWLRDLVETKLEPQELARRLTFAGLAVEAVHPAGDDWVLELDLTSNRGDCLSHLGVAREVAALEGAKVQSSKFKVQSLGGSAQDFASVEILDADLCPRYAASIIRGVKIGPSPEWMAKRLNAIGQRPLNNVADITNYALFELGQPLHAFDLATLKGPEIMVRRARAGEKMKTLDGVERTFDGEMLLICDAERAVAVAGVMGGLETEITEATTDVLLEAAYFTPASVRRTSRLLGLSTEASKRFERGVDPENVLRAQKRAAELICELAGGVMTENAIDVYPQPHQPVTLSIRPERIKALSGLDATPAEIARILGALGFTQQNERELIFAAPSWRHDMEREEDLIEEVARIKGYDRIPFALPPAVSAGEYLPNDKRRRALRRELVAQGYDEAIKFSFISQAHDEDLEFLPGLVEGEAGFITLSNSIIEGAPRMRPSLIPGLLEAARHNFNQGQRDLRLFELGRVFAAQSGQLPVEREAVGLLMTGQLSEAGTAAAGRELDFFDLKGALEAATAAMGLPPLVFAAAEVKHLRAGQSAQISLADGKTVGFAGRLRDEISAIYKFRQAVYLAELNLDLLLRAEEAVSRYTPLNRHPAITRDLSLLLSRRVAWAKLQQTVSDLQPEYCRSVRLVDIYEGANVPSDQRSLTIRLEYRAADRTLRDDEAETEHRRILVALSERLGAQQRA
jgi:phenylalanyl-tRNA synthetase beta chain